MIHSIEFNFDFHPIPLENFEIAKLIFNRYNQGIKQIEYKRGIVIFTSKLNKIKQPLTKIELYKGINMYLYPSK
jgi:hypothetical protein